MQPSRWLKARICGARATVTPGPNTTFGLDRHVGAKHGVGAQEDRRRIGHRHPAVHRGRAQPGLHHRLGRGQFGAGVDPGQLLGRRLDRGDPRAFGRASATTSVR